MGRFHSTWTAKGFAPAPLRRESSLGALDEDIFLECCQGRKQVQYEPTRRAAGVDVLGQGFEGHRTPGKGIYEGRKVPGASSEPIQARDDQSVALIQ